MKSSTPSMWKFAIRTGLLGGAIALLMGLVGMVSVFGERFIISGWFTMGQLLFIAPILLMVYSGLRKVGEMTKAKVIIFGLLSGTLSSLVLAALVLIGKYVNLREMFINASPKLYEILAFGQEFPVSLFVLAAVGLVTGAIGAGVFLLPKDWRSVLTQILLWVVLVGVLRDLIVTVSYLWGPLTPIVQGFFAQSGLKPPAALGLAILVGIGQYLLARNPEKGGLSTLRKQKPAVRWGVMAVGLVILLLLPVVLGPYFSEILDNVGLYILMGLGLNIVVGFAGLLDLGYVAFYAIGAYVMGVLTSPEMGFFSMTYWQALPFALIASVAAGFILGLPVLKMRGDYLAIVTLGFGEIIRLLALSDWLRPWLGGTQGIQSIAQPQIGTIVLDSQQDLYYLFLIGIAIVGFIAFRLKDSRMGRAWMALREDEDVAMAMGINHVSTKLLAFATGALFSGLAGTIFAAKLTSVYPHSMNLLVSINVLCLIIIGGMGSIPGVFVGALVLIGLPDLLREFAEFRYLVYGALLVAMMLTRPEGLWPEERRRLELHEAEIEAAAADIETEISPAG